MNKLLAGMGVVAVLVVPAGSVAKPNETEKRAAIAECKDERGKTKATRKAFKANYHSFSRCVAEQSAEEEAENKAAKENAAHECKTERSANPELFKQTYGTNKNGKNAYGKCVSGKASQKKAEMDAADAQEAAARRSAAKDCATERRDMGRPAFDAQYGTNRNDRNAFGKCVSDKSQAS
jgi:hypothetical protein